MLTKLFLSIILSVLFLARIYSQNNDVFICMIFNGDEHVRNGIYVDENLELDYLLRDEKLKDISSKSSGKEWIDSQIVYTNYLNDFADFTKLKIGDKYFISFTDKTIEMPVSFYSIWNEPYSGYELHGAFDVPGNANVPEKDYAHNITVCTKYDKCSPLNYESESNVGVIKMIKKVLSKYTKSLKVTDGYPEEDAEYIIMKGNFTSKGKTEYAVSVVKRISFENFASGVFIINEDGTKIIEVMPFKKADFNYNKMMAIVDYNGDGLYEMLIENGYYEGAGYDLWKYNGKSFDIITSGFYWGV